MSSLSSPAANPPSWVSPGSLIRLVVAVGLCFIAGAIGSWLTYPNIASWYAGLNKPFFSPPNWLFAPVWTCLYALIGLAFWRVWTLGSGPALQAAALAFGIQLILNVAWSGAFFALHAPGLALFVIVALIFAIIATMSAFGRIDRPAAWMLTPYLAWVLFATTLNTAIWWLN
jgi:benzodiazapine receptor